MILKIENFKYLFSFCMAMDNMLIRDVMLLQKRELTNRIKEEYIQRSNIAKFDTPLIKVIIGPRRAGKSFFAVHTLAKLHSRFGYANFDDEKLVELTDYDDLINIINTLYNNPKVLLFDEIQNLKNWELFVNRLQRQGYNLVITGSNSNLLSTELATHLTGRYAAMSILPFSFKEFLGMEKKELTSSEIKEKLNIYILYGGYPEPLFKKVDYKEYLSTLFDSIIYKDIVRRFKIRQVNAIENLANYLISNIAAEFSYHTLTKLTKCKSSHTIEKYLKYFGEAFVFFEISRFSYKLKEQLSSIKKVYCIDNGLIYAKAFKFSRNIGKLYENAVAIELKRRELNGSVKIYYWKNPQQEEVDFVIQEGIKIKQLIQVCVNLNDAKTKDRELRALLKAGREMKCSNLLVLTDNYSGSELVDWYGMKAKVRFIPVWEWLLA